MNKGAVEQGADGEGDGVDHEELAERTAAKKNEVRRGGGERMYGEKTDKG